MEEVVGLRHDLQCIFKIIYDSKNNKMIPFVFVLKKIKFDLLSITWMG